MSEYRAEGPFLTRIFRQLPLLFPIVALAHAALLVWGFISWRADLADPGIARTLAGLALYTVLWAFTCDLRKWAGTGYVILTAVSIAAQFYFAKTGIWQEVTSYFFPINLLFSFFILFYYKRLR